jgi:Fe-S-cluster containining protein
LKIFDFYQNIKCGRKKVISSFSKLSNVYNHLPKTTGCTENISKCNGCGGWCCRYQSPQLLYVEFLHIWKNVLKYLEINEIVDIIERSLYNYIEGDTTKGCIFLNKENSYCKIYKYRPFNCRTYGMIPNEEFNKNKEKVKEKMKGILGLVIKDQCDLVKIEDGKELTSDIRRKYWS